MAHTSIAWKVANALPPDGSAYQDRLFDLAEGVAIEKIARANHLSEGEMHQFFSKQFASLGIPFRHTDEEGIAILREAFVLLDTTKDT